MHKEKYKAYYYYLQFFKTICNHFITIFYLIYDIYVKVHLRSEVDTIVGQYGCKAAFPNKC
jgi:hypothetical protein